MREVCRRTGYVAARRTEGGCRRKESRLGTGGWKRRLYQRIPIAVWSAGIAAMMVIALGLGLDFLFGNQAGGSGEWSCYEGSYVWKWEASEFRM